MLSVENFSPRRIPQSFLGPGDSGNPEQVPCPGSAGPHLQAGRQSSALPKRVGAPLLPLSVLP